MQLPFSTSASICILGYGVNHQKLVGFLLRQGCNVVVRDSQSAKKEVLVKDYPEYGAQLTFESMSDITENLASFTVIFRSPSIPLHKENLQTAIAQGATVTSQTELFLQLCPAKTVGVTGTKGKGTTSTLIYQILQAGLGEKNVYLAGNIGVDPFSFLEELQEDDVVVLELSSFQLDGIRVSPAIAVVLHVAQDHLDHHKDLPAYREAKKNILSHQGEEGIAIINAEYDDMKMYLEAAKGRVITYHRSSPAQEAAWVHGEAGGREIIFAAIAGSVTSFDITERTLMGRHNLENILPAMLVGLLFAVSPTIMQEKIIAFRGLEHRLASIENQRGILAFDDSIATTPESTLVALQAFEGKRIHLIAGGKDKGQDNANLGQEIAKQCVSLLVLPGAASGDLIKKVRATSPEFQIIETSDVMGQDPIAQLIEKLGGALMSGDVLLLSPSAASDVPYANYKERGEAFMQAVSNLT